MAQTAADNTALLSQDPLVSIIIRSADARELDAALACALAQSYRNLELIVVDAAGDLGPGAPARRRLQPAVHLLSYGHRLSEARAGNAGLDAARGDFVCFLDDTTDYAAGHIEAMVAAAAANRHALAWYSRSRVAGLSAAAPLVGRPVNRELFFHDELISLQAALISRKAIELGCRFDEAFEVGAGHDFLEQVALHGEVVFLPSVPPTSSARAIVPSAGAQSLSRRIYYDNLRFAKWSGERLYHSLRAAHDCAQAAALREAGDHDAARRVCERVLDAYPGNPDALHGLALSDLSSGQLESAWEHLRGALEFDAANLDYRRTAGEIEHRLARLRSLPGVRGPAPRARDGNPDLQALSVPRPITPLVTLQPAAILRSSACACGSGKRYKHCCGQLMIARAPDPAVADAVARAQGLLDIGEAVRAAAALAPLQPQQVADADLAYAAGQACLRMHALPEALAWLRRAVEIGGPQHPAVAACDECCHLMFRATAWQSASRSLRGLIDRLNAGNRDLFGTVKPIHIVCKLDSIGGTERRALNLYRQLSPHAHVLLWSTLPPLAAHRAAAPIHCIGPDGAPAAGTLLLVGTYFDCGDWLETAAFERVVICHNLAEQYPTLMQRLIQIEQNPHRPRVELVYPSALFRRMLELSGRVEYAGVDLDLFRRRGARSPTGALVVGRHGRAYELKFHPNDPAFFRQLMQRGYRVRILGSDPVVGAFAGDSARPELLGVDAEPVADFLATLDVFVYRKHPRFFETGGTAIFEAMAMELPVVVFAEQCGAAEIIRDQENGFLVDSEGEAAAVIDRLADDRALRQRVGRAARATIVALLQNQEPELIDYYLAGNKRSTQQPEAAIDA